MASVLPNQLLPSSATGPTPLPKSLGTNLPAYPVGEDRTKLVETMSALNDSNKRMADLAAQQELNKAQAYKQYIDPVVTKYEEDSKKYKEKLEKFDGVDNAFHPTQENLPEIASIFSAVGILGSLFGGGARNSGMNALSSMTGMMEGWKIGDAEKFKREKASFDENRLQQRQQIDNIMKQWEQVAKEYVTNKEKAKADADVLIAQQGSSFIAETYRNKGLKETLEMIFKLKKSDADTQAHIDSVELKKATLASKQGGGAGARAYQDYFPGISFSGGVAEQRDKRDAINNGALSIATADDLKNYAREHRDQLGRKGQVAQNVERYYDSIKTGKGLESEDDKGQPALIFAKRYAAYLVGYERSLAGSNKAMTVAFQRRFNDLMSQNQFNSTGFESLMNEQMNEVARATASKDPAITGQGLFNYGKDIYSRGDLFPSEKTKTTKEEKIATVKDIEDYAEQHKMSFSAAKKHAVDNGYTVK